MLKLALQIITAFACTVCTKKCLLHKLTSDTTINKFLYKKILKTTNNNPTVPHTGVRKLRVSTESGHFCDFNNWARGVSPATIGSCTRAYKKHQIIFVGVTTTNHVARWPWCNYDGNNWDWCIGE